MPEQKPQKNAQKKAEGGNNKKGAGASYRDMLKQAGVGVGRSAGSDTTPKISGIGGGVFKKVDKI
mgnify:CR=1 FL=1